MKDTDFKDFQSCSKHFQYKQVPFASVAQITFSQNLFSVQYSTSHAQPLIGGVYGWRGGDVKGGGFKKEFNELQQYIIVCLECF